MAEETEVVQVETEEVPIEETTMAEFKAARKDGKAAGAVVERELPKEKEPEPEAEQEQEKQRPRGGKNVRLDKVTKNWHEAEAREAAAKQEAAELRAKLEERDAKGQENKAPVEAANFDPLANGPKESDFQYLPDYYKAAARHLQDNFPQEEQFQNKQDHMRAIYLTNKTIDLINENAERAAIVTDKIHNAQYRHADWNDLMTQNKDISLPAKVMDFIFRDPDFSPDDSVDLFHHLLKNREIIESISEIGKKSDDKAVREAYRISEAFFAASSGDSEQETAEEIAAREEAEAEEAEKAKAAEEEKMRRRPPAPIRPVLSGSTTRSRIPLDKAEYPDYKKRVERGER